MQKMPIGDLNVCFRLTTSYWRGFWNRASINSKTVTPQLRKAIDEVIAALDAGVIRVAEKKDGDWVTNQWIKKLFYFLLELKTIS